MPVLNYFSVEGELLGEQTGSGAGTRVDYLTDALGSVTATTDQAETVKNTYRYKPYGDQLAKSGTTSDPAFKWVGSQGYRNISKKYSDVYVRARHLSFQGRWTTKDPLGYYDGLNVYSYVSNRPTSFQDPSGLYSCSANCCCSVGNISQSYAPLPNTGRFAHYFGHLLTTTAVLRNIPSTKGGACSLKWFEKTSYADLPGQIKNVWQDVCANPSLANPCRSFSQSIPNSCPSGPITWKDVDPPAVGRNPGENQVRMLCIKVLITDGCTGRTTVKRFNQYLKVSGVKLVAIIPPGRSQMLESYCNK